MGMCGYGRRNSLAFRDAINAQRRSSFISDRHGGQHVAQYLHERLHAMIEEVHKSSIDDVVLFYKKLGQCAPPASHCELPGLNSTSPQGVTLNDSEAALYSLGFSTRITATN
jgi:hypothetical protein